MGNHRDLFELKIPPRLDYLSTVRRFVEDLSRHSGFKEPDIEKIVMAVDEATSNSITHKGTNREPLSITVEVTADSLIIRVLDSGSSFGIRFIEEIEIDTHLDEMRAKGLGLHIMKSFMDVVEYERTGDHKNLVTLTKLLAT